MLHRYPIGELKTGAISKRYGHAVVVMQFYPRFVKREMIDEYLHSLAPQKSLFQQFKAKARELKDHDRAFEEVQYEARFGLSTQGLQDLKRLSDLSGGKSVYLLCQCKATEHCHSDLLLLIAQKMFRASIQTLRVRYPLFEKRLARGVLESVEEG